MLYPLPWVRWGQVSSNEFNVRSLHEWCAVSVLSRPSSSVFVTNPSQFSLVPVNSRQFPSIPVNPAKPVSLVLDVAAAVGIAQKPFQNGDASAAVFKPGKKRAVRFQVKGFLCFFNSNILMQAFSKPSVNLPSKSFNCSLLQSPIQHKDQKFRQFV